MDWLAIVAMICAKDTHKQDCEKYVKDCIEWVSEQPETKSKGIDKDKVALWLQVDDKFRAKVCR